jgi:hypothetical protein
MNESLMDGWMDGWMDDATLTFARFSVRLCRATCSHNTGHTVLMSCGSGFGDGGRRSDRASGVVTMVPRVGVAVFHWTYVRTDAGGNEWKIMLLSF